MAATDVLKLARRSDGKVCRRLADGKLRRATTAGGACGCLCGCVPFPSPDDPSVILRKRPTTFDVSFSGIASPPAGYTCPSGVNQFISGSAPTGTYSGIQHDTSNDTGNSVASNCYWSPIGQVNTGTGYFASDVILHDLYAPTGTNSPTVLYIRVGLSCTTTYYRISVEARLYFTQFYGAGTGSTRPMIAFGQTQTTTLPFTTTGPWTFTNPIATNCYFSSLACTGGSAIVSANFT